MPDGKTTSRYLKLTPVVWNRRGCRFSRRAPPLPVRSQRLRCLIPHPRRGREKARSAAGVHQQAARQCGELLRPCLSFRAGELHMHLHEKPAIRQPVHRRFAPTALMFGNLVTGCSVLAPAGMLIELSSDLGVSVHTAGLLITFGAVMLCVGSPLTAWLTSWIERRSLLTATLAVLALGNFASAFAPDYASLLIIRLIMLAVGALYTPQAAGTAGADRFTRRSAAAPSPMCFWDGRWRQQSACR